jgi:hypothetical protein
VVNFSPLDDHPVDVNFGAIPGRSDLHLGNVALGNTLHPGDLVRIRLDWELVYPPSSDIQVKLTLLNEQGLPIQGVLDNLPPDRWRAGKISTYHLIPLPNETPDGPARLYLGIVIRGGVLGELQVAQVNVAR